MANNLMESPDIQKCTVRCFCNTRSSEHEKEACAKTFDTLDERFNKGDLKMNSEVILKTANAIDERFENAKKKGYDKNPINTFLNGTEVDFDYTPSENYADITYLLGDAYKFIQRKLHEENFRIVEVNRKTMVIKNEVDNTTSTYRIYDLLKRYEAPNELFKILTSLPAKKPRELVLEITTRPEDILLKSTCQNWTSCENLTQGEFREGPYSDVANWNGMAIVREKGKPREKWYGRQMLRWCIDEHGNKNVGVEPRFYGEESFEGGASDALMKVLEEHGLGNFEFCATPYKYEGYSDTTRRSGDQIIFGDATKYSISKMDDLFRNLLDRQIDEKRVFHCKIMTEGLEKKLLNLNFLGTFREFVEKYYPDSEAVSEIRNIATTIARDYGVYNNSRLMREFISDYMENGQFSDRFLHNILEAIYLWPSDLHGEHPYASCTILDKKYSDDPSLIGGFDEGSDAPIVVAESMDEFVDALSNAHDVGLLNDLFSTTLLLNEKKLFFTGSDEDIDKMKNFQDAAVVLSENFYYDLTNRHGLMSASQFDTPVALDHEQVYNEVMFLANMNRYFHYAYYYNNINQDRFDDWFSILDAVNTKLENGQKVNIHEIKNLAGNAMQSAGRNESKNADEFIKAIKYTLGLKTEDKKSPTQEEHFMEAIDEMLRDKNS